MEAPSVLRAQASGSSLADQVLNKFYEHMTSVSAESLFYKNSVSRRLRPTYLPTRAIQAIAGAMRSYTSMETKMQSDEAAQDVFLRVEYELLKRDAGAELLQGAHR